MDHETDKPLLLGQRWVFREAVLNDKQLKLTGFNIKTRTVTFTYKCSITTTYMLYIIGGLCRLGIKSNSNRNTLPKHTETKHY